MQAPYNPYGVMPDPYGGSYNPYMAPPPPGYMMPPGGMQQLAPTAPYAVPGMPPSTGAPMGAPPGMHGDEPRTVFITGFPPDVKERELNNMLRFVPGYEASQMNWKNGQARSHVPEADEDSRMLTLNIPEKTCCPRSDPGSPD